MGSLGGYLGVFLASRFAPLALSWDRIDLANPVWRWTLVASEVGQCVRQVAPAVTWRTDQGSLLLPWESKQIAVMEPKPKKLVLWYIATKTLQFTNKTTKPLQREVITVLEVEITPVRDGTSREHHDQCEHNCSRQWQKLNWFRSVEPHCFDPERLHYRQGHPTRAGGFSLFLTMGCF